MGKINFNNDIEYETGENKFKLTRGKLIIGISIIVIVIILIIVLISAIVPDRQDRISREEFVKLENRMKEEALLYVAQKQIVLTEQPYKIPLSELLVENSGTIDPEKNPAAKICDGYVLASKVDIEKYESYITCGRAYETSWYVSNDIEEVTTTTKKEVDDKGPDLILNGSKNIVLRVGESYNEPGFTAIDNIDKDITSKVLVSGNVDTSTPGDYVLVYSVSDNSGNKTEQKRTISIIGNVTTTTKPTTTTSQVRTTTYQIRTTTKKTTTRQENPKIPPTISLYGSRIIELSVGDKYKDPGYSARDCMGADITTSVKVTGSVNTKVSTTYYVTYSVTDKYGNKAVTTRTIIVKSKNIPVEGISISPNYVELSKGVTKRLDVYINPSNATNKTITWTSSNDSIAMISNGVVTGINKGTAIITATTSNGKSYSIRVEVK